MRLSPNASTVAEASSGGSRGVCSPQLATSAASKPCVKPMCNPQSTMPMPTTAILGFRVSTALVQPLGLTQSIVRVGPQWVAKGMVRWLSHPQAVIEEIYGTPEKAGKSVYMRERARTQTRDINEIRNSLRPAGKFRTVYEQAALFMTAHVGQNHAHDVLVYLSVAHQSDRRNAQALTINIPSTLMAAGTVVFGLAIWTLTHDLRGEIDSLQKVADTPDDEIMEIRRSARRRVWKITKILCYTITLVTIAFSYYRFFP